jgi:hypothetical protein
VDYSLSRRLKMLRHRVTIEYNIDEKYMRDVPSLAYADVMDLMQLNEEDKEYCNVTLVELCTWPGCDKVATHPGLGAMPDEGNRYCDDHCVGGG